MMAVKILVFLSIVSVFGTELTLARQIDIVEGELNDVYGRERREGVPPPVSDEDKEMYLTTMNSFRSATGSSSMNQLVMVHSQGG